MIFYFILKLVYLSNERRFSYFLKTKLKLDPFSFDKKKVYQNRLTRYDFINVLKWSNVIVTKLYT